ncbi:hypothetical protein IQ07DRAFT_591914 [Pyrenochaeta sp. DS3sAY3a]|nr:hypothetical protein IQ07DRAFT_591914 [Pyrenochaeta sp. DS3sAY3a]
MATTTLLGLTLTLSPPALTLLRLAPLLSSTASLTHAYMEYLTVSSFTVAPPTTNALSRTMLGNQAPPPTSSSPVNAAELAAANEVAAPSWFVNFFNTGVWSVIGLNSVTLLSGAVNAFLFRAGLGPRSSVLYQVGLGAAVAHYAFVPLVAGSVERLYVLCVRGERGEDAGVGKGAVESVREWVGWHVWRMGSVDCVAWGAFLGGVVSWVGSK